MFLINKVIIEITSRRFKNHMQRKQKRLYLYAYGSKEYNDLNRKINIIKLKYNMAYYLEQAHYVSDKKLLQMSEIIGDNLPQIILILMKEHDEYITDINDFELLTDVATRIRTELRWSINRR